MTLPPHNAPRRTRTVCFPRLRRGAGGARKRSVVFDNQWQAPLGEETPSGSASAPRMRGVCARPGEAGAGGGASGRLRGPGLGFWGPRLGFRGSAGGLGAALLAPAAWPYSPRRRPVCPQRGGPGHGEGSRGWGGGRVCE